MICLALKDLLILENWPAVKCLLSWSKGSLCPGLGHVDKRPFKLRERSTTKSRAQSKVSFAVDLLLKYLLDGTSYRGGICISGCQSG